MHHPDPLLDSIARLLIEIGEPVYMHFEPRNEGMEWTVGLMNHEGFDLPVHEHFADPVEGLIWLSRNGKFIQEQRARR